MIFELPNHAITFTFREFIKSFGPNCPVFFLPPLFSPFLSPLWSHYGVGPTSLCITPERCRTSGAEARKASDEMPSLDALATAMTTMAVGHGHHPLIHAGIREAHNEAVVYMANVQDPTTFMLEGNRVGIDVADEQERGEGRSRV